LPEKGVNRKLKALQSGKTQNRSIRGKSDFLKGSFQLTLETDDGR
jgi:hypothetical protein